MTFATDNTLATTKPARLKALCVYCGSSSGIDPRFQAAARTLGAALAQNDIRLVYGGGGHGLMGTLARAVIEGGGKVTGIVPEFLKRYELSEPHEQIVVPDMSVRKRLLYEHADAFVALPGGIGTLEELVEQLTLFRLEWHAKPILMADIGGFWRPLIALFQHMRETGFIEDRLKLHYLVADRAEDIVPMLHKSFEA